MAIMEMSMKDIILDKTDVEAGWVKHSDDLGGETNHGITHTTSREHMHLWNKYGWNGDMRTLPKELAYEIYEVSWWNRLGCPAIMGLRDKRGNLVEGRSYIAERLFDFGINAGRENAARSLQRWLNALNRMQSDYADIKVDGGIGGLTIAALEAYCSRNDPEGLLKLVSLLHSSQNHHYLEITEKRERNESFTNGWVNRVWRDTKNYWYHFFRR